MSSIMNRMEIIERYLQGKSPDDNSCEDKLVVTESFVAVIDGATYKGNAMLPELPGKLVSILIETALGKLPPRLDARESIDIITKDVKAGLHQLDTESINQAAASVVILSLNRREIWRVGDGLYRINDREYMPIPSIDGHMAAIRSCYNTTFHLDGESINALRAHDKGRELILPLLTRKYRFRNSEVDTHFAFGAIDGTRVPDRFIEVMRLPPETCEVVLCSDGYPRVLSSLSESEAYLAKILLTDPLCIDLFMATKGVKIGDRSFDDRVYIRLRV